MNSVLNLKLDSSSSLLKAVNYYLDYYASSSGHTARAKKLDLQKFISFLTAHLGFSRSDKLKLSDWSHSNIQRFVEESLAIESPSTVARRLATIKHMGRTYAEKIQGFINPAKEIKTPKIKKAAPKALNHEELELIRQKSFERISAKDSYIRYRNQVILFFILETGLRADEVRLLRESQIDQNYEWLSNVRTKGKRYRNVYISEKLRPILVEYMEKREQEFKKFSEKISLNIRKNLPLFISTYAARLSEPKSFQMGAKTLWRAINEMSTDTGLHPHLLRHTFAVDLLRSSKDIRLVSQALGHGDVKITMRYTERSDFEVAQAIEQKRSIA